MINTDNIKFIEGGVTEPLGFKAAGVHCGLRKNKSKKDLALIAADNVCSAAAVYTLNKVFGAPIAVTKEHLKNGKARAVICNSGIANTCNPDGLEVANEICRAAAEYFGFAEEDIIVASTGVIGARLPVDPIKDGLPLLKDALGTERENGDDAAVAIMTTDTRKKSYAVEFTIGGKTAKIGLIAKGSGMIQPNMATMLCFITTDVNISSECLQSALSDVIKDTFNMVSIDGDTSTNDMVSVMASGACGNEYINEKNNDYETFRNALYTICRKVSMAIAFDGEGATKLITCNVSNASSESDARKLAKSVINSSLVKTAMFGADANWGREMCALGYSGVDFNPNLVDISFSSTAGSIDVCKNGVSIEVDEVFAKEILTLELIDININMNAGNFSATAWGCDLSYEYVRINGDYRS